MFEETYHQRSIHHSMNTWALMLSQNVSLSMAIPSRSVYDLEAKRNASGGYTAAVDGYQGIKMAARVMKPKYL